MADPIGQFRATIRRRAILMEIGGFRPPESPASSWFGRVRLALPGEVWPRTTGVPMHALCQINLTELPFRPPRLDDLDLIAVFVGPAELPVDEPNGTHWCLRAYPRLSELVPLEPIKTDSRIVPYPMRPVVIEEDYPCWEDLAAEVPAEVRDSYHDLFPNVPGFKLGGWPTLVQHEIEWPRGDETHFTSEYVFQIDTTEKGNWMWGDNGVGYFGRGNTRGHESEWSLDWQCY